MKEAERKQKELLEAATKEAEQIKSEQIQSMKQKADTDMEAAKEKGTQNLEKATAEIAREVAALKELAMQKEDAAINGVIAGLI